MYISQISIISADISRNQKVEKSLVLFFFKSTYFWSSRLQMFFKVGVLKSYAIFTGKHLRWGHFWTKFQSFRPTTLKVTLTKVFFCEYCKIFKNSFFHRTPPVAASVNCKRRSLFQDMTSLFLSINSGWLTVFVRSKVTRGDSFDFKMLLTISNLQ